MKLYKFGGFISTKKKHTNTLFELSLDKTFKWKKIFKEENWPKGRIGHTIDYFKNSLYIYGGWNNKEIFKDIFKYSIKSKKWTKVGNKRAP